MTDTHNPAAMADQVNSSPRGLATDALGGSAPAGVPANGHIEPQIDFPIIFFMGYSCEETLIEVPGFISHEYFGEIF
jgi:hypothetical protein